MKLLAVGILASIPVGFFSVIVVVSGWAVAVWVFGVFVALFFLACVVTWAIEELQ